jgi:ribonuclease HII
MTVNGSFFWNLVTKRWRVRLALWLKAESYLIMAILVGIDEAGYGPILGPLVVSAAVFRLPDEQLGSSLWDILRRSVSKKASGTAGRVAINDSKKLHSSRKDYSLLQRGVLMALAVSDSARIPENFGELLQTVGADCAESLAEYPWYGAPILERHLSFDNDDIAIGANALKHDMIQHHISLLHLWSRPLLTGEYNRQVELSKNKATVLFSRVSQFVYDFFQNYGDQENNLQILIDKLGGRAHYRQQLQRIFPDLQMKILKEEGQLSSYHLTGSGRSVKIHFLAKGDDRHLPVALASMTSKYLRELFMEAFNDWFQEKCQDLKPTAGYYTDGKRFLEDLGSRIDMSQIPAELLIRQR